MQTARERNLKIIAQEQDGCYGQKVLLRNVLKPGTLHIERNTG